MREPLSWLHDKRHTGLQAKRLRKLNHGAPDLWVVGVASTRADEADIGTADSARQTQKL